MTDFRFYFGAANGSAQKALRTMEEPNVMISAETKNNRPWGGIESLIIDSGGYSLMLQTGEHRDTETYLDYCARVGADVFAVQDYPCEPEILEKYGRNVENHQKMTTERTADCLDMTDKRDMDADPMAVVQGWTVDDYLAHVDSLRDRGLLTERLAIGSICRRGVDVELAAIIRAVGDATPPSTKLHAFGVKVGVLSQPGIVDTLASADSCAYDYRESSILDHRWQDVAFHYLKMKRRIEKITPDDAQQTLAEVG